MNFSDVKFRVGKLLDSHPILSHLTYELIVAMPFFLPHDRTYSGLCNIKTAENLPILDIGANNGISALSLRKLFPEREIICFEPNPRHFKSLTRISERDRKIHFQKCGLGKESAEIRFYQPFYNNFPIHTATSSDFDFMNAQLKSIGVDLKKVRTEEFNAPVKTLDELDMSPSIMKIDCEGMELSVLEGATKTILSSRPLILTEYSGAIRGYAYQEAFNRFLKQHSYLALWFESETNKFREFIFDDYKSITGCRNIFLVEFSVGSKILNEK